MAEDQVLFLKWASRYRVLGLSVHKTLDDAVDSARYASDAGDEWLEGIEVLGPEPRWLDRSEVEELWKPAERAERERYKAAPLPVVSLRVLPPDPIKRESPYGKRSLTEALSEAPALRSFSDVAEAEKELARLKPILGDRVQLVPIRR